VNLSGNVQIGNGVLTGTGCQILERLSIGNNVTMGAGAVVTKNVPDSLTVIGVPAKPKTL
jgi:serine acetyltransferase